ncbi:unnamed protein product [Musa banksii]
MGCVASKVPVTPAADSSGVSGSLETSRDLLPASSSLWNEPQVDNDEFGDQSESEKSANVESAGDSSENFQLRNMNRCTEGEQVAAGWPSWLSSVAREAIQGWVPLKADSFEKLGKIGQGTYSSVFRAREIDTGRIVALKKVHFDNFEPESVRFMAREIQILRKLDHPNIMKLEGIITSRLSCSIYLVFEYMEHDLAGLSSSPDINFSEQQIKCYMKQLLSGIEQCHSRGIIHRDIKCANLLVNNEGILKVADFGLANILNPGEKQPLTSRVVTLWYRPPELLLGSTDYDASVDLWSVGCVFAELFLGMPILQGRTEVEQMHKIFKLCGSPPEDYWKKSKTPHATVFKPQHPYESCLQTTYNFLPESALKLLGTFLSIEPDKRGTASTALTSEVILVQNLYFRAKPYASDPSSLPKYQPNKEIDAKFREESRRRGVNGRLRVAEATGKPSRANKPSHESNNLAKIASQGEGLKIAQGTNRSGPKRDISGVNGQQQIPTARSRDEHQQVKPISQGDTYSGPLIVSACTGFACTKKPKDDHPHIKPQAKTRSRQDKLGKLDPSNNSQVKSAFKFNGEENGYLGYAPHSNSKGHKPYESTKDAMLKQWLHPELQDSMHSFAAYHPRDAVVLSKNQGLGYRDRAEKVDFSGPVLLQSEKVDEFLEKHEQHVRKAMRKSWFQRAGQKQGL